METYGKMLNKAAKFHVKISSHFWKISQKIRGGIFSAAICILSAAIKYVTSRTYVNDAKVVN